MHISDTIAALFAAIGFEARQTRDGREFSGRINGAAMPGEFSPNGARIMRFTLDGSGRWLAIVDGWGKVQADCDLRRFEARPAEAIEAISGTAWPAIRTAIEAARGECAQQADNAAIAAGLSKGAKRRKLAGWQSQHLRNALAIDAALNGKPAPMSDDELFAALSSD